MQDVLVNTTGQRYIVLDLLGAGTFGQVVSSYSEAEGRKVAVKVCVYRLFGRGFGEGGVKSRVDSRSCIKCWHANRSYSSTPTSTP